MNKIYFKPILGQKSQFSYENYADLTRALEKQLSQDQLLKAKELTKIYFDKYAQVNSKVLIGPISQKGTAKSTQFKFKDVHKEAPKHPRTMAIKGTQGWVDVSFNIYPDGTAKDIHIIEEIPNEGLFAKATIKSIEQYRFAFYEELAEPFPATTRIEFKMRGQPDGLSKKQQKYIDDLIKKAKEGNIESQYSYAILFNTFLRKKGGISGEQVNQWLFNAAQNGVADAQYRLGKNIYFGKACKVEKQKGLDWIMRAAQIGNADAEYMAYQMLKNNKNIINQSNQDPIYWLQQAAKNGSNIAQIKYAGEITKSSNPNPQELAIAEKYLDAYQKKFYKTVQWYQINALVQNKLNRPSKALKSIKSTIRSAKKAGWDLTELEQQRDLIQAQKS
ncbi:MAG: energy transducer TonB [Proteobacteria bacterium]|nr:energy transducer TonB [Pseudomonadota bacterium]